MAQYTYDQFKKKLTDSGVYMSDADLALAQRDPDAGMSLISYKLDYANATDEAGRAAANKGAENIRATYGGYTSGADGSSFYKADPTPSSFAPTKSTSFADSYGDKYNELLDTVTNYKDFSYDPESDESYKSYAKAYAREGERATKNALTEASARTGGVASSYAATAAAQAGNYYASQMADKIPQLYESAYNRYLNEFELKKAGLDAVSAARQMERSIYESDLAQENYENEFKYNQLLDQINYGANKNATELANAYKAAEAGDFSFLRKMGVDTANLETLYNLGMRGAELDNAIAEAGLKGQEISNEGAAFTNAIDRYNSAGDTAALRAVGINNVTDLDKMWRSQVDTFVAENAANVKLVNSQISSSQLDQALALANVGQFGALRALGYDTTELENEYRSVKAAEAQMRTLELSTAGYDNLAALAQLSAGGTETPAYSDAELTAALMKASSGGTLTAKEIEILSAAGYMDAKATRGTDNPANDPDLDTFYSGIRSKAEFAKNPVTGYPSWEAYVCDMALQHEQTTGAAVADRVLEIYGDDKVYDWLNKKYGMTEE